MLQAGQGIPAPPQSQPCGPSQGRRRWFSQTHPVSAHRMHFIGRRHFPDARRLKLSAQPSLDVLNRIAGDRTDRRCKARRAGTAFAPSGRGISDIGLKVINAAWRPSRGKIDRRILPLSVRERERIIFSAGMELLQSNGKQPFPRPSAAQRYTREKAPRLARRGPFRSDRSDYLGVPASLDGSPTGPLLAVGGKLGEPFGPVSDDRTGPAPMPVVPCMTVPRAGEPLPTCCEPFELPLRSVIPPCAAATPADPSTMATASDVILYFDFIGLLPDQSLPALGSFNRASSRSFLPGKQPSLRRIAPRLPR